MTLAEKADLITGAHDPDYRGQSGYAPGVPRLDIPPLRWGNGPVGIELAADATAIPAGLPLAATFDVDLSYRVGILLGQEARALGIDVLNGPQLDIARIPTWGRNSTSVGEDPLLAGVLGASQVQGIQAQGVLATPKHYVAYTQKQHVRSGTRQYITPYDFIIDSRALREIYLPSFEAAAKAGAASFMSSHMIANGFWGSENKLYLTDVLRDELGWNGFVVSDWHGTHSRYALVAGVDVEMPGYGIEGAPPRPYYFGDKLAADVTDGRVPEALVNRAVGRLLTQMEEFGFLDNTRVRGPGSIDIEAGARLAREVAVKGAVLLKNDGALPLRSGPRSSLVFIGPTAGQPAVGAGNGRAYGFESREISPLDAMRKIVPNTTYAVGDSLTGVAVPSAVLTPDSGQANGLTRVSATGESVDPTVDFVGDEALPPGTAISWTGSLAVPETGPYLLMIQSWGGTAVLKVDGIEKATSAKVNTHGFARKWTSLLPTTDDLDNGQAQILLEKGRSYRIALDAAGTGDAPVQVRLAWVTPQMRRAHIADAAGKARNAETAVVFAWAESGEFIDADEFLLLPNDQNKLIREVAAANPNTIVVLNTGGPVLMPWLDRVKAVVQMWYPGQEGGWATIDILTGNVNPGGKLPITFPVRIEDTPAGDPDHPERVGVDQKVIQSEGIFVGYRHYDRNDIDPLFPFGHGLSYTDFVYSDLVIHDSGTGFVVEFSVENTGSYAGSEIPQVYVGPVTSDIPMPPKTLAGFQRVDLDPGETERIQITVPERQLAYWSIVERNWAVPAGSRPVYVGTSSREILLSGTLRD